MRKTIGYILLVIGSWMMVSPQALLGLPQLKWMHDYSFAGEVLLGIVVLCAAYYCLGFKAQLPHKK